MSAKKIFYLGPYAFAPNFKAMVIVIILLPILISLGFWQLERAQEKQDIMNTYLTRNQTTVTNLDKVNITPTAFRYFSAQLTGDYDNEHSFLLDNKINKGRPGYQVITPFYAQQSSTPILVNRGWIPLGNNRQSLPHIPKAVGKQQLKGFIYVPFGQAFVFNDKVQLQANWPKRIQSLDFNLLADKLAYPISQYVILLAPDQKTGFVRDWKLINMKPEKHLGYAIQWFALAATLLILFIGISFTRMDKRNGSNKTS